jgi:hypothetical protein
VNIYYQDPNEVRLQPEEVRLLVLRVIPQGNAGRVKVYIEMTPFMKRPNIDVTITTEEGMTVAHTSILDALQPKLEFTMHLREPVPGSRYRMDAVVYYQKLPEPTETPMDIALPEPMIVDRCKETFTLPP